ncbi:acyl-CoA thioesterase domain-containing protein [Streptomyces sp. SID3343]|uniref:acyl-CoA thioesterase n=1 Tax=Streptomyces sp. SID3343 TaxID=2690260 RepID=UPI001F3ADD7F|nr:acyl-CoA thioesterase domain-containing protein [Streptomyces sp. SID3343]
MWPSITADDVLDALELERVAAAPGESRDVVVFRARNIVSRVPRTLGAQLLAQTVVAAERVVPHMTVQTLQGAFPRAGDPSLPVDVRVERLHEGRSVAMLQVGFRQGDNEHCRAIVTLGGPGAELVRHGDVLAADVPGPEECAEFPVPMLPWEVRTVGGVEALAPELAGPPRLDLWMRMPGGRLPDAGTWARAVVAYATEGFLGPVALRPYPSDEIARRGGRAMSVALAQNVTFHDEFSVGEWVLLRCASEYAGGGRMHGRIRVFARDGRLVASVTADGLMRPGLRR